jgi:hypothetical protein
MTGVGGRRSAAHRMPLDLSVSLVYFVPSGDLKEQKQ